ncbi:YciI family protein [Ekhidna sp.]|uniref:YciI family protein n=1 Tax=Ekhidna sp. TaxID=2608089 RepID=UPI003B503348
MNDEHLSDEEIRRFKDLDNEQVPPRALEQKIINSLKNEGLISSSGSATIIRWSLRVAASVLIFLSGIFFQQWRAEETAPEQSFMLLLHEDENFQAGDPMKMFEAHSNWIKKVSERGIRIQGQELKNDAILISNEGQEVKNNDRITGYFIFESSSIEEALAIAKDNPHTTYGGTVELKQFMVR